MCVLYMCVYVLLAVNKSKFGVFFLKMVAMFLFFFKMAAIFKVDTKVA